MRNPLHMMLQALMGELVSISDCGIRNYVSREEKCGLKIN